MPNSAEPSLQTLNNSHDFTTGLNHFLSMQLSCFLFFALIFRISVLEKGKQSKWLHWITLQLYAPEKPTVPQINFLLKIFCFLVNLLAPLFVFSLHRHHLFLEWLMAAVTIFDKNIGRKKIGVSIWSKFKVLSLF